MAASGQTRPEAAEGWYRLKLDHRPTYMVIDSSTVLVAPRGLQERRRQEF